MIERYDHNSVAWLDVLNPSPEEIRELMEEYDIPPELIGDLSGPVPRSSAITSDNALKVTLDFPVVKRTDIESPHEIKFIITKRALISVRYEDITAVHKFGKEFEVLSILTQTDKSAHGGHLFIALMCTLYDSLSAKLDYLESRLNEIEREIFNDREREMVPEISKVSRRLIVFRQTIASHKEVLEEAAPILSHLFEGSFGKELDSLTRSCHHLNRRVRSLTDTHEELRNTNMAMLSTRQNEIMQILTIMAFITFPLTLITSVFGMNTNTLPLVGREGDFWIIIGIMGVATIGFFIFFKYKKWI